MCVCVGGERGIGRCVCKEKCVEIYVWGEREWGWRGGRVEVLMCYTNMMSVSKVRLACTDGTYCNYM